MPWSTEVLLVVFFFLGLELKLYCSSSYSNCLAKLHPIITYNFNTVMQHGSPKLGTSFEWRLRKQPEHINRI